MLHMPFPMPASQLKMEWVIPVLSLGVALWYHRTAKNNHANQRTQTQAATKQLARLQATARAAAAGAAAAAEAAVAAAE